MKVTDPIDVFLADKLFQLDQQPPRPSPRPEATTARRSTGRTLVVLGGSYGIGADIAELAERLRRHRRALVQPVAAPTPTSSGAADWSRPLGAGRSTQTGPDRLRGQHRRRAAAGKLARDHRGDDLREPPRSTTSAPVLIAQAVLPAPARDRAAACCCSPPAPTPAAAAGYSLYSSAKAAVVNLTQALADEWAADGVRVNCVNPERTGTPMRTKAFGEEPPDTLLSPRRSPRPRSTS